MILPGVNKLSASLPLPSVESFSVKAQSNIVLFHYVFSDKARAMIEDRGIIVPADQCKSAKTLQKYASRTASGDPADYYKDLYDKFYRRTTGQEYRNYGIWFSPVDVFAFSKYPVFRIPITIDMLAGKTLVLQTGKKVRLLTNAKQLSKVMQDFDTVDKCKEAWTNAHPKYRFGGLPQVIDFSGNIEVDPNTMETHPGWKG